MEETPKIYEAICCVMDDIKAVDKKKKSEQGFHYRGVDDVMNAVQPAFIKNKVFVVPTVLEEKRSERQTKSGGVLFCTYLRMSYRFFAIDGSSVEAVVIGEAMDSGDKSTNKAMSIAYKYALFQVLSIPTEEMQDPDAQGHDLKPTYIDDIKLKVLKENMKKKGVQAKLWNGTPLEKLTTVEFKNAMDALEKVPDKKEQSNLDL